MPSPSGRMTPAVAATTVPATTTVPPATVPAATAAMTPTGTSESEVGNRRPDESSEEESRKAKGQSSAHGIRSCSGTPSV